MVAMAAIARNPEDPFLGASVVVAEGVTDAETAEALACREALALAQDLASRKIKIASDCLSVINNLQAGGMSRYSQVIREINATSSGFESCVFVFESRMSNGDAHELARSSIYKDVGRYVWLITPPEGVCNILQI